MLATALEDLGAEVVSVSQLTKWTFPSCTLVHGTTDVSTSLIFRHGSPMLTNNLVDISATSAKTKLNAV